MKIIASTVNLQRVVKSCLGSKALIRTFDVSKNRLYFNDENYICVEIIGNYSYEGRFNTMQWAKILMFLIQLEEQPIVIEFKSCTDTKFYEKPEIEFSEFIKRF